MPTLTTLDAARVQRAVDAGWRKLEPFRRVRNYGMREYVGAWYGLVPDLVARADSDKRPINLIHQFVQTHIYALIGESLRFEVKPRRVGLRGEAKIRELMLNHRADEIGLLETHRLVTLDALFSGLGIYVVGTGESGDVVRFRGEYFDPGEFFCGRIDLDDFAFDPNARDMRETQFRAHRFRTVKETLLEMYPQAADAIRALPTLRAGGQDNQGDSHEIGGRTPAGEEWVFDEVEVWEITVYLGKQAVRGLVGSLNGPGEWLVEPSEYMGMEGGPYVLLGFETVPNNPMPVAPVSTIMDLHFAMAKCGVKAVRQILNARRNVFYGPGEEDAVVRVMDSQDDESIKCANPEKIRTEEFGGLSQGVVRGFDWLKTEANNATNNLQQASGVAGGASTATEAAYLQNNMQRLTSGMRAQARRALATVAKHMAWDLDTNVLLRRVFSQRIPGGGMLDLVYDGSALEANFTEFTWDVCPYEEPTGDRNMELARFTQMLQALVPAVQGVAAVGGSVPTLMRIMAQKFGTPELDELFPDQDVMAAQRVAGMMAQPGGVVGVRQPLRAMARGGRPIDQTRSDMAATVPGAGMNGVAGRLAR